MVNQHLTNKEDNKMKYLFKEDVVHAYPDGWSCVDKKTIDVNCLYVIETENGTECLECSKRANK